MDTGFSASPTASKYVGPVTPFTGSSGPVAARASRSALRSASMVSGLGEISALRSASTITLAASAAKAEYHPGDRS